MHKLLAALTGTEKFTSTATGLRGSAPALLAARLLSSRHQPLVVIVPSEEQAATFEQDLELFTTSPVLLYPGYDIPPYTPLSPDPVTVAARLSTLYRVQNCREPFILVIPAEALLRRVLPREKLGELAELVMRGEETDQDDLCHRLVRAGYEQVSLVRNPGEFSRRGSILDIFPPYPGEAVPLATLAAKLPGNCPVRLDFFGDLVESLRFFDPISQRSLQELAEFTILPVSDILFPTGTKDFPQPATTLRRLGREQNWDRDKTEALTDRLASGQRFPGIEFLLPLFYPETATPLDYLPPETLLLMVDPGEITATINLAWERITANQAAAQAHRDPALPAEQIFLSGPELSEQLDRFALIQLHDFPAVASTEPEPTSATAAATPIAFTLVKATPPARVFPITTGNHTLLRQELELERRRSGLLPPLATRIGQWLNEGDRVSIACRSGRHAEQLAEFLGQHGLITTPAPLPLTTESSSTAVSLYPTPLAAGFDLPDEKLHLLSETELFGEKRLSRRKVKGPPPGEAISFEELKAGDIVVHRTHGLGSYAGLINMTVSSIPGDYLQLVFAGEDKLYVPVDRLNMVHKYQGLSDQKPSLDRLGGKGWAAAKEKVKEAVWKVAQELLDLYARRQLAVGRRFSGPDELYAELEESFPFDETPGQLKAINEVIDDLASEKVMDRLVCGDVGYGKTEVAIRGAFKVAADGYQVAILVPTTVLAEQHAATFRERLAGFPLRVECLNRFRPAAEMKKTLHDLHEGKVDIVIGTHRLLSKDVVFRKLGLLIIDEEHRFGVKDKEKIKKLRTGIDVLTLTATPIPRTLQLSLLGIRDLSVISSPPRQRRSVKTFVAKVDDLVIKEAVTRELQRGGQVFVVHNRVQSIAEMAHRIQELRPEARVAVAHGQMPGRTLEEIMFRFVQKEIDVLVCTTIIESGLDIPNANTIILTRADRLGLAEIYQLRGRVGRSSEQAYAYLLVPSLEGLSREAQQRLRALMDYNELGGGFKLAMSDLQIRGGGNILGESQSGTIAAVGYDLYLELLQQTVEDLKRQRDGDGPPPDDDLEPEINLRLPAFLPEYYLRDTDLRYLAYRQITSCHSDEALDAMREELRDRFGALPEEAENLLAVVGLKDDLLFLKISRLDQGDDNLVLTFTDRTPLEPAKLLARIATSKGRWRLTTNNRLVVQLKPGSGAAILSEAKNILHTLRGDAT
ncbi:MAG: transcription-repair coupling factor [Desulfobulbaceae bacterium]|nr:transcription-repair coupling factor [Desulfobulbaceae bacterium]